METNSMLNAVHCSDHLVGRLIENIRSLSVAKNTLIVIASDHLALRNTATETLNRGDRRNLFIAIRPGSSQPMVVSGSGSILDIGVTTLNMMGVEIPALGYGRDLLGNDETLVESQTSPTDFLASQRGSLRDLWQYPDISDGISIDLNERHMMLKNQRVELPALIEINDDLQTTNISFQFNSHRKLSELTREFSTEQALVWIDECEVLRAFSTTSQVESAGLCIAAGKVGGEKVLLRNLGKRSEVTYEDLRSALLSKVEKKKIVRIRNQLQVAAEFGQFPLPYITLPVSVGLRSTVSLFSSGHPLDGPSYILNESIPKKTVENIKGLNLFALSSDGEPKRLKNVDICKTIDDTQAKSDFSDLIKRNQDEARVFIVMTNHLAKCLPNSETIQFYLKRLPFRQWSDIEQRRSFIGVLVDKAVKFESIGKTDGHLALRINTELPGTGGSI